MFKVYVQTRKRIEIRIYKFKILFILFKRKKYLSLFYYSKQQGKYLANNFFPNWRNMILFTIIWRYITNVEKIVFEIPIYCIVLYLFNDLSVGDVENVALWARTHWRRFAQCYRNGSLQYNAIIWSFKRYFSIFIT